MFSILKQSLSVGVWEEMMSKSNYSPSNNFLKRKKKKINESRRRGKIRNKNKKNKRENMEKAGIKRMKHSIFDIIYILSNETKTAFKPIFPVHDGPSILR